MADSKLENLTIKLITGKQLAWIHATNAVIQNTTIDSAALYHVISAKNAICFDFLPEFARQPQKSPQC